MPGSRPILGWFAGLALVLGLASSCSEEAERIDMSPVPPPPGGVVETIGLLESGESSQVVAPTRDDLFVRSPDRNAWHRRATEWPEGWRESATSPLAGVMWSKESFNFPSDQRFTTHAGRLVMLTRRVNSKRVQLLASTDGGGTWGTRPLPERYRSGLSPGGERRGTQGSDLARVDVRTPLRLVDRGSRGLFLLDESHVWRATFENQGAESTAKLSGWSPIDVSNIKVLGSAESTPLPTVVRNYLPPSDKRPFEMLTTFGERLYIYRRHRDSDDWLLVSTLPTIDIELYAPRRRSSVYLLAPDALYRSGRYGERWEKLAISQPLDRQPANRTAAFVRKTDPEGPAPPDVLVGTGRGAIYRSSDGGDTWTLARKADPDRRAITGFAVDSKSGRIWASTAGLGVLASGNRGRDWSQKTEGLRSTRPLALEIGLNDELVLGTRAGLFRLTGAPTDGHWNRYHDRATSAIEIDHERSRLFSGTIGGSIVAEPEPVHAAPARMRLERQTNAPLFRPWTIPSSITDPRAIVSLRTRPNSQNMYGWSRKRGMLTSTDDGTTWHPSALNRSLTTALERSLVTNFLVDENGGMYLTSQRFDPGARAQLWRSVNEGDTWHSIYTSPADSADQPMLLRQSRRASPGTIFLARGNQLGRSSNSGEQWSTLDGPWTHGTIRAHSIHDGRHAVVFNTPHSARVTLGRAPLKEEGATRTYTMNWSQSGPGPRSDIRDVLSVNQFVFVITDAALYAGTIPESESQLPHAPTIIATLIFMLLMIGVSFWYLRFEL